MTEKNQNSKYDIYKACSDAGMSIEEAAIKMGIQAATVKSYARDHSLPFRGLVFFNPATRPEKPKRKGIVTWERREEYGHINRVSLVAVPGVQIGRVG